MRKQTIRRFLLWTGAAAFAACPSFAGTLGLRWNAATGAAGYRVYYGNAPGTYTSSIDVRNVLSTSITGLSDCAPTYLAVKSYNFSGESATFSQEVSSFPRPVVNSATPDAALQGAQVLFTLAGTNFESGSTVTIDNPDIHIDSASMTSCTSAQVLVTIEPTAANVRPAEVGRFTVSVTNPHAVTGSKASEFEVVVNPARFDINQNDASDDRLDGMDTVWLSRVFGAAEGGSLYDPDFDFDGDGWIDGSDLAYLSSNLGRCWTGTGWNGLACQ